MSISTPATSLPTPTLTPRHVFSANVTLAESLGPIPRFEGGSRLVEPIISGTIYGPAFNATIEGGLAVVVTIETNENSKTIKVTSIYLYGHASDGSPFYIEETGSGTNSTQNTRLMIEVGGEYRALQSMYVLGQPAINEARTEVWVECFGIPLANGQMHA